MPPLRLGQSPSSQAHSSENTNTKRSFTLTVITRGKARRSAALQIHFLTPLELSILGQNGLQFTLNLELLIDLMLKKESVRIFSFFSISNYAYLVFLIFSSFISCFYFFVFSFIFCSFSSILF